MAITKYLYSCMFFSIPFFAIADESMQKSIPITIQVRNFSCSEEFNINLYEDSEAHFFEASQQEGITNNTMNLYSPQGNMIPIVNMSLNANEIDLKFECNCIGDNLNFNIYLPLTLVDQTQIYANFSEGAEISIVSEDIWGSPVPVIAPGQGAPIQLKNQ